MKNIIKKIFLGIGALGIAIGSVFGINAIIKANKEESPIIMNDVEENGIRLKYNKIVASGTDTNILASITAVVGPNYIYDKTVSWSVAWASTNSKNIDEFVGLSVSTDTLTCNITVKKSFNTQIILSCIAKSNNSVKATCTLDYVGRNPQTATSLDYSGDPYNKSILDVLNNISSNQFSTNGGTLKGSLSNFNYLGMVVTMADGKVIEIQDLTQSIGDFIEDILTNNNYNYTLDEVISRLGTGNVKFFGTCDINYNNTLIKSDASFTLIMPIRNLDASYFVADSVSLSDSQLIF